MKLRVERDGLADAVAWTAKSLPSRPSVPVLAGVLLRVSGGRLTVSGFDYEVSSQVSTDVQSDADGAALVSGRLLAEITKALPAKPVDVAAVGSHLELVCGSARFTLPTMPVEDYPTLPEMPATAGTVDAAGFAAAVSQVAVAAGRAGCQPAGAGTSEDPGRHGQDARPAGWRGDRRTGPRRDGRGHDRVRRRPATDHQPAARRRLPEGPQPAARPPRRAGPAAGRRAGRGGPAGRAGGRADHAGTAVVRRGRSGCRGRGQRGRAGE